MIPGITFLNIGKKCGNSVETCIDLLKRKNIFLINFGDLWGFDSSFRYFIKLYGNTLETFE